MVWSNQKLISFLPRFWNMHPSLFLAALCLGIASAAPKLDQSLDAHWSQWKVAHRKLYEEVGNIGAVQ